MSPPAKVEVERLVTIKLVRVVVPAENVELNATAPPTESVLAKRLVDEAVVLNQLVLVAFVATRLVAKKLVDVAEVEVEVSEVKSLSVVEPERSKFESEVSPAVAERVPVKLAADEIV